MLVKVLHGPDQVATGKIQCDSVITNELIRDIKSFKHDFGHFPGHPLSDTQGGWCSARIQRHHPEVLKGITPIRRVDLVTSIRCLKELKLAPNTSIPPRENRPENDDDDDDH